MEKNKLSKLKEILKCADSHGIDVSDLLRKVDAASSHSGSPTIKIVLMGAFSDGKTTVIGGITGQLESNMKIAIEESSDDIIFYHFPALGYDFEIVDTPGLFGTKEKEIDGRSVRYSEITREYISQAHIVIYVTEAVNPLKDSHGEILRFVLRDMNKLQSAIFVINKMDDAGYELLDDDDFARGEKIKSSSFIQKLTEIASLTPSEQKALNVVCVSANPNGRGLEKHFQKMDAYLKKSRINLLRERILQVASSADKDELKKNVEESSFTDLARQSLGVFKKYLIKTSNDISELEELSQDTAARLSRVRSTAITNRGYLDAELRAKEKEIEVAVQTATMNDFSNVVREHFGEKGERLERTISETFSKYTEMNNAAFKNAHIDAKFDRMGDLTKGIINSTASILKRTQVTGDMVKAGRDFLSSGYKFKPWGAIKLGKNLTKAIGVFSLVLDAFMWWRDYRENQKFQEAKSKLINCCKNAFIDAEKYLSPDDKYLENFAPGVITVENALKDTRENIQNFKMLKVSVQELVDKLQKWVSDADTNISY